MIIPLAFNQQMSIVVSVLIMKKSASQDQVDTASLNAQNEFTTVGLKTSQLVRGFFFFFF